MHRRKKKVRVDNLSKKAEHDLIQGCEMILLFIALLHIRTTFDPQCLRLFFRRVFQQTVQTYPEKAPKKA